MQNIQENVQTTTHRQRCSFSGSVNTCERREQPVNNHLRHFKGLMIMLFMDILHQTKLLDLFQFYHKGRVFQAVAYHFGSIV